MFVWLENMDMSINLDNVAMIHHAVKNFKDGDAYTMVYFAAADSQVESELVAIRIDDPDDRKTLTRVTGAIDCPFSLGAGSKPVARAAGRGASGAGRGIIMRLQFDFTNAEKEGMLKVLAKYPVAPDHHSEITEMLKVDGSTVLSRMDARYLAGIICPYYAFLAERLLGHPGWSDAVSGE